jgi:hypothetical protein
VKLFLAYASSWRIVGIVNTTNTTTGAGNTTAAQIANQLLLTLHEIQSLANEIKRSHVADLIANKCADAIANYNQSAELSADQRIVPHPDHEGSFALLDVYGEYFRSHHGFVMRFTEGGAMGMLGFRDKNHPLI